MPCGGVYTVTPLTKIESEWDICVYCNKFKRNGKTPNHYVEEWDGFMLHGECVLPWLETDDGQVVMIHEHLVQVDGEVLYEEGEKR